MEIVAPRWKGVLTILPRTSCIVAYRLQTTKSNTQMLSQASRWFKQPFTRDIPKVLIIWRFPAPSTIDDSFVETLRGWWMMFEYDNKIHAHVLYWSTTNAVLRGRLIPYVLKIKQRSNLQYSAASKRLRKAYWTFVANVRKENRWVEAKANLELWLDRREDLYRQSKIVSLWQQGGQTAG